MSMDNLPYQPPFALAAANDYVAQIQRLSREAARRTRCKLDIPFGPEDRQKLDIYLPADRALVKLPVLLFIHGGAWTHGFKEWMGFMAPSFVTLPCLFVSSSYGLAPTYRFPVPLNDCFAALRWIVDNISSYGGDPSNVFIGGHASGGHLAALATLRHDQAAMFGLPRDAVKACFPVSGIYTFEFDALPAGSSEARYSANLLPSREAAPEASPLRFVDGNKTPFLLCYGSKDSEIVVRTSEQMRDALARTSCRLLTMCQEGLDHFTTNLQAADPESIWVQAVRAWMQDGPLKA